MAAQEHLQLRTAFCPEPSGGDNPWICPTVLRGPVRGGNENTTCEMPPVHLRRRTLPFARWSMDFRYYCWGTHASCASSSPSWSGVNRVSRSRLAGSSVAKLGDESSATRHEWVRRDAHAAKPAGSREVTQISIATSPDPNIRRH